MQGTTLQTHLFLINPLQDPWLRCAPLHYQRPRRHQRSQDVAKDESESHKPEPRQLKPILVQGPLSLPLMSCFPPSFSEVQACRVCTKIVQQMSRL